jgi:formate/nitrite transporter FocA (FNT family)
MAESGPAQGSARDKEHIDDKVAQAVDRLVEEGTPRLHRPWPDLLATATVAGMEVTLGILALLVVKHETGSALLGGIGFGFGFLALLLGHSELFTEGFLVPIVVVAAKSATVRDILRFWVGSAIGNLVGGWILSWFVMEAFPDLHAVAISAAIPFVNGGITLHSFSLAVLAGSAITLMTRMHNGTDSDAVRVLVSLFAGWMLAGLGLAHSILESILIFCALNTAHTSFGYLDWLGWFGWTVLGNVVGGVGLVTLLRLWRSRELLQAHHDEDSGQPRTA